LSSCSTLNWWCFGTEVVRQILSDGFAATFLVDDDASDLLSESCSDLRENTAEASDADAELCTSARNWQVAPAMSRLLGERSYPGCFPATISGTTSAPPMVLSFAAPVNKDLQVFSNLQVLMPAHHLQVRKQLFLQRFTPRHVPWVFPILNLFRNRCEVATFF